MFFALGERGWVRRVVDTRFYWISAVSCFILLLQNHSGTFILSYGEAHASEAGKLPKPRLLPTANCSALFTTAIINSEWGRSLAIWSLWERTWPYQDSLGFSDQNLIITVLYVKWLYKLSSKLGHFWEWKGTLLIITLKQQAWLGCMVTVILANSIWNVN